MSRGFYWVLVVRVGIEHDPELQSPRWNNDIAAARQIQLLILLAIKAMSQFIRLTLSIQQHRVVEQRHRGQPLSQA